MTVLHDVTSQIGTTGTTGASPQSVSHAASANAVAAIVLITIGGASTDVVTSVTYGGVTMTRMRTDSATSAEAGRTYVYFLGWGQCPSGTQTATVNYTGTTAKSMSVSTVRSDRGAKTLMTVAGIAGHTNTTTTQVTALTLGPGGQSDNSMMFAATFSGTAGPMSSTATPNTLVTTIVDDIAGVLTGGTFRQTNASEAGFTIRYTTGASDDFCSSAISVIEYGTGWSFTLPEHPGHPEDQVNEFSFTAAVYSFVHVVNSLGAG